MSRLQGRTAIVTGANFADGVNIGGATARLLAQEGANVVVADLPGRGSKELADLLQGEGLSVIAHEVDLRAEVEIAGLIERAVTEFGGLHILHNNAGVVPTTDQDVLTMTIETWDLVFSVDVRG